MENFAYNFEFSIDIYNFIIDNVPLYDYHKEKEIFDLLYQGYPCREIGEKLGCSTRTIQRRKRDIYKKIEKFLMQNEINITDCVIQEKNTNDSIFCVYMLLFPNNKVYIGQTINTRNRWGNNGIGYINNKEMYTDIQKYGWENIKKQIVYNNLTHNESLEKEKELIIHYKSNIPEYGYNKVF